MEIKKWDGVTDADLILKALLFFIDEEDEEKALKTSYGDFGKYLQKMYRGSGAGNGDISVESFKGNPRITLKKKNVSYQLTWNKAAKLIHQYLHGRNKKMKAYKGFKTDMTCRGFQFEEGKEYHEDSAVLCNSGFHACEAPLDCFSYYSPAESVYHEVELDEVSDERESDSKICGKNIKIGARLNIANLCKLQFDYVKSHCTNEYNAEKGKAATAGNYGAATAGDSGAATAGNYGAATAGDSGAATAGNYGAATAGDSGAATAGNYGAATAGDRGAATAGNYGAATAGDRGAATAGYSGAATAGDRGAATAGDSGAATAGNYGAATSRGSTAVGENGVALCRGNDIKARGGLGSILVIAVENEDNYDIKEWKAEVVDGVKIKADTWYKLENGEFVEIEDETT